MDISERLDKLDDEVRTGRAEALEARLRDAQFRLDVFARLDTLIGAVADLRAEYHNHTHG